jgi:hypothetical protein
MKIRAATRAQRSPSGAQVAFGRAANGAMGLGTLAVGALAIGALAIGRTPGEARQDRAPQHRGARGRTAACEGVGRRAGAAGRCSNVTGVT